MRGYPALLASLLALFALPVMAGDFSAQLNQFFKARDPEHATGMNVVIRTPQAQWPLCDTPQFTLPGNSRPWGNMSVAANCGENRRYIQVQVQVTGRYLVAKNSIARGATVSKDDFRIEEGRLDTLPPRTLLNDETVADSVVLRDIQPGQPVSQSMLRQPWRVKAGQDVMVVASGDGFDASGEGKALSNGTIAQWVRVRMGNGQVVSGRVSDDGKILITL